MEESRRQFVAALTAGVTGALAGCGGSESTTEDGTPAGTDTPAPAETDTPTATGTDTPTPSETDTPTPTATDPAQVVTVGIDESLRFAPESFEVPVGSTVQWQWEVGNHNVKADTVPDGSDWSGTPGSELYGSGHTYSYTFDVAGDYSYYCAPHRSSGMTGSFVVK